MISQLSLTLLCALFIASSFHYSAATLLVDVEPNGQTRGGRFQQLMGYPRSVKRSGNPSALLKRKDFLNFLADSWQQTGSLRNAIREIQDMTESKRSVSGIVPGPRVGKRIPLARMGR